MQIRGVTVFLFPVQSLLFVHDAVAQRDFEPTLPPIPDDVLEEDEESLKIVSLVKTKEPLVSEIHMCMVSNVIYLLYLLCTYLPWINNNSDTAFKECNQSSHLNPSKKANNQISREVPLRNSSWTLEKPFIGMEFLPLLLMQKYFALTEKCIFHFPQVKPSKKFTTILYFTACQSAPYVVYLALHWTQNKHKCKYLGSDKHVTGQLHLVLIKCPSPSIINILHRLQWIFLSQLEVCQVVWQPNARMKKGLQPWKWQET